MKYLLINVVCGIRSTGRICTDLAQELEKQGHEVKIAYGREEVPEAYQKYAVRIGNGLDVYLHVAKARLLDAAGFGSKRATREFLEWVDEYKPDVIWLHNLHGYYINVAELFDWLKRHPEIEKKWTLHDCWAFTGHCVYFTMAKCDRWEKECHACPNKKEYPSSYVLDRSRYNYHTKKELFTGINNLSLITPSKWLAGLVKESFLKEYPVEVKYNTIDTTVFKPTSSDFRKQYGIEDKIVILGVASKWEKRKGLEDFIELSQMLDGRYVIVLVGLKKETLEKKVMTRKRDEKCASKKSRSRIIPIPHTSSATELAAIYTMADLFVNPTHEDNYPTVNLEAAACGTFVISYDVGGAEETIVDGHGIAIQGTTSRLWKSVQGYL